jgi:hypothetical protein
MINTSHTHLPMLGMEEKKKILINNMLTKDINSKLRIDWREKAIHKVNKPPRYVESNCYWK